MLLKRLLGLFPLLYYIREALGACAEGCLKCQVGTSADGTCLICDAFRGYILKGTSCEKQAIDNCLIAFYPGFCSICDFGYYLTPDLKCGAVPRNTKISIESCNNYLTSTTCLVCDFYTYERNGKCRPIQDQIDSCTMYSSPTQCEICNLKLPAFSRGSCEPVTTRLSEKANKCLLFRHPLRCNKCRPGYDIEENYFLANLDKPATHQSFFFQLKFWRDAYFSVMYNPPVCNFRYSIDNCAVLDYNQTCAVCAAGYTLSPDRTRCFQRPKPPADPRMRIPNCYKFASQNYETCQICYETFFLQDLNTRCKRHTNVVPNCSIHSQTTDSQCIYCDNPYYLNITETNSTLSCVKRANFFNNCQTYHRTKDMCNSCMTGHLFHFNNARCSQMIDNCLDHNTTDRILKCSNCIDTHYLNDFNTLCIDAKASTEGCKKYNYNAVCLVCSQDFYLDTVTKKCFTQDPFIDCQTRSVTVKGECDVCNSQGTRTQKVDNCINVGLINIIADCQQYDKSQVCTQCKTGKVPFLADGKVTCIDFEGCNRLVSQTDATRCAECYDPYFLYLDLCLKADLDKCLYSFSRNSTFATSYSFVDEVPCELCEKNTYYTTSPGQRDSRCITVTFGKNCLDFYAPDANLATSGNCVTCRRGYMKDPTKPLECMANDVYAPYTTGLATRDIRTLSSDTTQSYLYTSFTASTMFPGHTFTGNPADASAATFCYQASADRSRCLSCKISYCAVYKAAKVEDMINPANMYSHTSFVYSTNATKVTYEAMFSDQSYPVSDCVYCATANTTSYPKEAHMYIINSVTHYICKWAHDLSMWTVNNVAMTLSITITSTSVPVGYVWGTTASYTSSCQHNIASSTPRIANCKTNFNETDLALTFEQRMFLYSCQVCLTGYALSYANYSATVTYGASSTTFRWIINECNDVNFIASYFKVDNCFYYYKVYRNEQMYYECKACNVGASPVLRTAVYVCPLTDPKYSLTKEDHCLDPWVCDKHLYCRKPCSPACPTGQYCTPTGSCVNIICDYCANTPSDPDCAGSVNGCPDSQYCQEGQCLAKCTCRFGEQCDKSTNYICVPYMCGDYTQKNMNQLIADIPSLKAAMVDALVAAKEAADLAAAKAQAAQAAADASASATAAAASAAAAATSYTNAQTSYDAIFANAYATAADKTAAQTLLDAALAAKTAAATASTNAQAQSDLATIAAGNANAASLSTEAQPFANAAVTAKTSASGFASTAQSQSSIANTKQTDLANARLVLENKVTAAEAFMQTAINNAILANNAYLSADSKLTAMIAAYPDRDFTTTNALMTNIDSDLATALTAKNNAASAAASAASTLPGSDFAVTAATNSGNAAASYTLIATIRNTAFGINEAVRAYKYSLDTLTAYTTSQTAYASAEAGFASSDMAAVTAALSTIDAQKTLATTAKNNAQTTATLVGTTLPSSNYATDATAFAGYAAGNVTAITALSTQSVMMGYAITAYTSKETVLTQKTTMDGYVNAAATAYTTYDLATILTQLASATTLYSSITTNVGTAQTASNSATALDSASIYATSAATSVTQALAAQTAAAAGKTSIQMMSYAAQAYGNTTAVQTQATTMDGYFDAASAAYTTKTLATILTQLTSATTLYTAMTTNVGKAQSASTSAATLDSASTYATDAAGFVTTAVTAQGGALADKNDIQSMSYATQVYGNATYVAANKTLACEASAKATDQGTYTGAQRQQFAADTGTYYQKVLTAYNVISGLVTSAKAASSSTTNAWYSELDGFAATALQNKDDAYVCYQAVNLPVERRRLLLETPTDFVDPPLLAQTGTEVALVPQALTHPAWLVPRLLQTRADFVIQVDAMYWGPGCPINNFCFQSTCIPILGCPVCDKDKYCVRTSGPGGWTYSCVADTYCNTNCKPVNKYCWGAVVSGTYKAASCQTYPQRVIDTASVCSPACAATHVCVDGVCTRSFQDACRFGLLNSVPIYCGTDEFCQNEVCIKNCQPKCEIGYTCDTANNRCVENAFLIPPQVIKECRAVDLCATDHTARRLNWCDRCMETAAFLTVNVVDGSGNSVQQIKNDTCKDVSVRNCKSVFPSPADASVYTCIQCEPGFTLVDGVCIAKVRNCKEFDATGKCRWCTLVYFNEDRIMMDGIFETGGCKTYPVVGAKATANPTTDSNCLYFKYFYSTAPLKPAAISGGSNVCHACQTGFFITTDKKCLPASIANCVSYDPASTAASIRCLTCDVGFTKNVAGTTCTDNRPADPKFEIPQCARYTTGGSCAVCNNNYMLKTVAANPFGQTTYCFSAIPSDPNCQSIDTTRFTTDGKVACSVCRKIEGNFAYPGVLDTPIKMCLPIALKSNCATQNSDQFTKNYVCTSCTATYYLQAATNLCVYRNNYPVDNCIEYAIDADTCTKLKEGTTTVVTNTDVVSLDVQKLIATPPIKLETEMTVDFKGWIMGCKTYLDAITCYECYPHKYLYEFGFDYNTKCKSVDKPITHCARYHSDGATCLACDTFYLLVDNQCVLKTVERCLEYDGPDACRSCPATHPVIDEDGNCSIDPSNPWCYLFDNEVPGLQTYECETCKEGYYPNDAGICTMVTNPIQDCKYYSSDRLCKTCDSGFYLRYDGKSCDINPSFDENCVEFEYKTECSVCEFGHFLKNGTCTECPGIEAGCAFCNPTNTTQCVMCKFGYEMGVDGSCKLATGVSVNNTFVKVFHYNAVSTSQGFVDEESSLYASQQGAALPPLAAILLFALLAWLW